MTNEKIYYEIRLRLRENFWLNQTRYWDKLQELNDNLMKKLESISIVNDLILEEVVK